MREHVDLGWVGSAVDDFNANADISGSALAYSMVISK
jgi:hypothetical protein